MNVRLLLLTLLAACALAAVGLLRLDIDTDVIHSMPSGDPVLTDALNVFSHHPIQDQVAVDVSIEPSSPDRLVECGKYLEQRLRQSGLFVRVGMGDISGKIASLASHVVANLPLLFSGTDLRQQVAPRLQESWLRRHLQQEYARLSTLEGIGAARFIQDDPLALKDIVLARMAALRPTTGATLYRGQLLSADRRHLLITARPRAGGTDTAAARRISDLLQQVAGELQSRYGGDTARVTLTPVGAYRAALDNEEIIRHDVNLALALATGGIALLLLISFPRPLIGLLSLVPALAGTAAGLFVYSLLYRSISIMVLGFGGALISITVDHGIAYLLFLDQPRSTLGKEASHEVRAIGIMAVITTIGAFLLLALSGFPIFTELGRFTALGILFSFLFVHLAFPRIFPVMPPAVERKLPLQWLVDRLYGTGWTGVTVALLFFVIMLFFAAPSFRVDMESMNTVSRDTREADVRFTAIWGKMSGRVYLLQTASSAVELQRAGDILLARLQTDAQKGIIRPPFVPSMLFPGPDLAANHLAAWHDFWSTSRIRTFEKALGKAAAATGFDPSGFAGFLATITPGYHLTAVPIPKKYFDILGISRDHDHSRLLQTITVKPGKEYDGATFFNRYSGECHVFDPVFFSARLARHLFQTFTRMLIILATGLTVLLFFFYLDIGLTLLTLLPVIFSYICTLGSLRLLHHPVDIPGLMLSVVILGMGIDYSIFMVRAHQRYRDPGHPAYALVRRAVFLAAASTLIGFGVLCTAEHSLLRSIGIVSLLGIGYCLLGAFLLLPPILNLFFARDCRKAAIDSSRHQHTIAAAIRCRYRTLEAYPRMFARFKLHYDPMFHELPEFLPAANKMTSGLLCDIGCGYGVPACWCLEYYPDAELYGLDPDPERVRVARVACGRQGHVTIGRAPDLPALPRAADCILILDMLHYLDDTTLQQLLTNCRKALAPQGRLVMRFAVPQEGTVSPAWRLEELRIRWNGYRGRFRSQQQMKNFVREAGLTVHGGQLSRANHELAWIVATKG